MVFTKNINEEAEVPASDEVRDSAIELVEKILDKLKNCDGECEEEVEVEEEACKESTVMESARILAGSMVNVMDSYEDPEVKLEAVSMLNNSLQTLIEAETECAGELPDCAPDNESDNEVDSELGMWNPTDVDEDADYGEVKESAADLILSILNK